MEVSDLREQVTQLQSASGHLDWIWDAWWRLGDERPHIVTGMPAPMGATLIKSVPGKIGWSSVVMWCDVNGYGSDDREMLDLCIQAMDRAYLEWWAERNKPGK